MNGGIGIKVRIREIADIRSGLVLARKQAQELSEHSYRLLTLKSFSPDAYIKEEFLDVFHSFDRLNEDYLTRVGDIIVRLSMPYTAVLIDDTTSGHVISSHFAIVRPHPQRVKPEYLYWFLNSDIAKRKFLQNNTSNMLGAIRPHFIGDLSIKLPIMQDQEIASELYLLSKHELRLLSQLQEQKEQYSKLLLERLYKGEK